MCLVCDFCVVCLGIGVCLGVIVFVLCDSSSVLGIEMRALWYFWFLLLVCVCLVVCVT